MTTTRQLFEDEEDRHNPWSVPAMDSLYTRLHEEMFKAAPAANEDGLHPREAWRASSLGRCERYQILERAGHPKPPIDEDSRRRMDLGSDIHWLYSLKRARMGVMLAKEIAITDPELSFTGHIDLIWGGPIQDIPENWRVFRKPDWIFFLEELRHQARERWGDVAPVTMEELKTTGSWGFRNMRLDGRIDYRMQLGGYRLLGERHPDLLPADVEAYQIVVFNRESGAVREIPMQDWWRDAALERLDHLNDAWHTGIWPNCTCGSTDGIEWERKLCAFQNEDGDGCCGQNLLALLEASVEGTS